MNPIKYTKKRWFKASLALRGLTIPRFAQHIGTSKYSIYRSLDNVNSNKNKVDKEINKLIDNTKQELKDELVTVLEMKVVS